MKYIFILFGVGFIGIAYIGVLLPGIPTTLPALIALWFFGKSSPRLEKWLRENRLFGRYLRQWETMRVFPKGGKITMYAMLGLSSTIFALRFPPAAFLSFAALSIALVLWSLPYPENEKEYRQLQLRGRRKYRLTERFGKKVDKKGDIE